MIELRESQIFDLRQPTIENHRVNICNKLELHRSHALVKFAIEHRRTGRR